MAFEWMNNDVNTMTVTFTANNITLNKAACRYFSETSYVLLGLDVEKNQVGIKPVLKVELENKIYPKNQLHKISLGKSYGRIANKSFMKALASTADISFENNDTLKYEAYFDAKKQILTIQV